MGSNREHTYSRTQHPHIHFCLISSHSYNLSVVARLYREGGNTTNSFNNELLTLAHKQCRVPVSRKTSLMGLSLLPTTWAPHSSCQRGTRLKTSGWCKLKRPWAGSRYITPCISKPEDVILVWYSSTKMIVLQIYLWKIRSNEICLFTPQDLLTNQQLWDYCSVV